MELFRVFYCQNCVFRPEKELKINLKTVFLRVLWDFFDAFLLQVCQLYQLFRWYSTTHN